MGEKKKPRETKRHLELFEKYAELRDFDKLSKETGIKKNTLYKYSTVFEWKKRIEQLDLEAKRKLEEQMRKQIEETRKTALNGLSFAIVQMTNNILSGMVEWDSSQDYERIIKLFLTLTGEASEITKSTVDVSSKDAIEAVEKLAESLSNMYKEIDLEPVKDDED